MRYLFVGGTGVLSSECAALVLRQGHELTLVNRGRATPVPPPPGARTVVADARNATGLRETLSRTAEGERFDAVVQFIGYEPGHIADDVVTFAPRADHYVFISTTATYRPSEPFAPFTEEAEQYNPRWEYAQKKIEAERVLREYATDADLPYTIVRPAHTYGPWKIPAYVGNSPHSWTVIDRMRRGADILVPGDGTSPWTLTHARDFATGLVGLLGNEAAFGEAVHITSAEALTWDGIYQTIARAAGLTDAQFAALEIHVPSDAIVAASPSSSGGVYGDKMHPAVFDTSKIRRLVPGFEAKISFDQGVRESIAWFEAHASHQTVDAAANRVFDRVARIYRTALRESASAR